MTLKEARKNSKMKQGDVADMFGIPLRTYQNWELEVRKGPDYVTDRIVRALNSLKKNEKYVSAVVDYDRHDNFITVCKTRQEAILEGEIQWDRLTRQEKENRKIVAGAIVQTTVDHETTYGDMWEVYKEYK